MKTLILGANGKIARWVVKDATDAAGEFILTSRTANDGVQAIDAADVEALTDVMAGVDVVYTNLWDKGRTVTIAQAVVEAMHRAGVKRLIWIATVGIYGEVAAANKATALAYFGSHEDPTTYFGEEAAAAQVIEESDLDWTIVRPTTLENEPTIQPIHEQLDRKEVLGGHVNRRTVAHYVLPLLTDPTRHVRESVALSAQD